MYSIQGLEFRKLYIMHGLKQKKKYELKRKLERLNPLQLIFSVMVFLKVPLNRILWMT